MCVSVSPPKPTLIVFNDQQDGDEDDGGDGGKFSESALLY